MHSLPQPASSEQEKTALPVVRRYAGHRVPAVGARGATQPAAPAAGNCLATGSGPRQAPRPAAAGPEWPGNMPLSLLYAYAYDTPLPAAELSTRTYNALRKVHIMTIKQFCAMELRDLRWLRNFGKKSVAEVKAYRERLGVPVK